MKKICQEEVKKSKKAIKEAFETVQKSSEIPTENGKDLHKWLLQIITNFKSYTSFQEFLITKGEDTDPLVKFLKYGVFDLGVEAKDKVKGAKKQKSIKLLNIQGQRKQNASEEFFMSTPEINIKDLVEILRKDRRYLTNFNTRSYEARVESSSQATTHQARKKLSATNVLLYSEE